MIIDDDMLAPNAPIFNNPMPYCVRRNLETNSDAAREKFFGEDEFALDMAEAMMFVARGIDEN